MGSKDLNGTITRVRNVLAILIGSCVLLGTVASAIVVTAQTKGGVADNSKDIEELKPRIRDNEDFKIEMRTKITSIEKSSRRQEIMSDKIWDKVSAL